MIDTTRDCIRLYSFSGTYGHTTGEIFLQADESGYTQYFATNQVGSGRDTKQAFVAYQVRVNRKEIKRILRRLQE
jgi:hypothetical protein